MLLHVAVATIGMSIDWGGIVSTGAQNVHEYQGSVKQWMALGSELNVSACLGERWTVGIGGAILAGYYYGGASVLRRTDWALRAVGHFRIATSDRSSHGPIAGVSAAHSVADDHEPSHHQPLTGRYGVFGGYRGRFLTLTENVWVSTEATIHYSPEIRPNWAAPYAYESAEARVRLGIEWTL